MLLQAFAFASSWLQHVISDDTIQFNSIVVSYLIADVDDQCLPVFPVISFLKQSSSILLIGQQLQTIHVCCSLPPPVSFTFNFSCQQLVFQTFLSAQMSQKLKLFFPATGQVRFFPATGTM